MHEITQSPVSSLKKHSKYIFVSAYDYNGITFNPFRPGR